MKLTIKDVKKVDDPYKIPDSEITIYKVWAHCEIEKDGVRTGKDVAVRAYTTKLELLNDHTYEDGVNCKVIEYKAITTKTGNGYDQYTIKALPSENSGKYSNGNKGGGFEKMDETTFFDGVDKCWTKAKELILVPGVEVDSMMLDTMCKVFSTLQINYCDHVKPESKINEAADKVKNSVDGVMVDENPFSDNDTPF